MKFLFNQNNLVLWLVIGIPIFFIGYLDIAPKVTALIKVQATLSELKAQFYFKKNAIDQAAHTIQRKWHINPEKNWTAELLASILLAGEANGLDVELIQPVANHTVAAINTVTLHFVAKGNFLQFAEFAVLLMQNKTPVVLTNFSLQHDKNGRLIIDSLLMGFDLSIDEPYKTMQLKATDKNPFVSKVEGVFELTNQSARENFSLHNVSYQRLKWVGYMHHYNKFWALVMLPSGQTLEVAENDQVGIEQARVVSLNESEIELVLQNKSISVRYSI